MGTKIRRSNLIYSGLLNQIREGMSDRIKKVNQPQKYYSVVYTLYHDLNDYGSFALHFDTLLDKENNTF